MKFKTFGNQNDPAVLFFHAIFTGRPVPFGYRLVDNGRKNKKGKSTLDLAKDPATAHVRLKLFLMVQYEGYGSHQLGEWLNRQGYRTSTGAKFHSGGVLRILKSPLNRGFLVRGNVSSERIPELQIVPDQLFFRVQQILEERACKEEHKRTVCRTNKSQFLLGGNLFCGHCGCRLVASRRTEKTVHKDGRAPDLHFDVSAKRNAVVPTARQSGVLPACGRNRSQSSGLLCHGSSIMSPTF